VGPPQSGAGERHADEQCAGDDEPSRKHQVSGHQVDLSHSPRNALTDFAMKHVRPARLQIRAERENAASRRVAEKSGFELEGIHRNESTGNDGTLRDMCYYAFIPPAAVACRNSR